MKNIEIVVQESLNNQIFTQSQIDSFLENGNEIPLKSASEWEKAGFMVKEGEKACLSTKLWKNCKGKKGPGKEIKNQFYLVPTNLYTFDQVEKIS